jgi:hypothetical protein
MSQIKDSMIDGLLQIVASASTKPLGFRGHRFERLIQIRSFNQEMNYRLILDWEA